MNSLKDSGWMVDELVNSDAVFHVPALTGLVTIAAAAKANGYCST